jgi:hypothetical protein
VPEKKQPSRRVVYGLLAFFFVSALGLLAGAAWSYHDEHSGPATTAHVRECHSVGKGKGSNTYCTARWTVDDRTVTGDLWNGKMSYPGKDVDVRIHGDRAVVPQLWVSIGLAVFGLAIAAVGVWLLTIFRRRLGTQAT